MDPSGAIGIGTCTHGPVYLSNSTTEENKYSITIINYDGSRHVNLINSKTTSQKVTTLWPDEIYLNDLFGKGPSKIQVSNVTRIRKEKISRHRHMGNIDRNLLPKFEYGLKVAIKMGVFDAKEALDLADSWKSLFPVNTN